MAEHSLITWASVPEGCAESCLDELEPTDSTIYFRLATSADSIAGLVHGDVGILTGTAYGTGPPEEGAVFFTLANAVFLGSTPSPTKPGSVTAAWRGVSADGETNPLSFCRS